MRSPIRLRRLLAVRRRSENPDVALLQDELESRERELREAHILIERQRTELDDRTAEAEALRRVGEATGSAFDLEEILKATADTAMQVTGTDSCQVYLYDRERRELVLRAADETARSMVGRLRLRLGEGITGWVARERRHVAVVSGATKDHRFKYFPEIHEEEYESILSVPLVFNNEVIGVINVRTRQPRSYTKHQVRVLSGIASHVAGAVQKARRTRHLEKTAVQIHTLSAVSEAITRNIYIDELLKLFVDMTARTMNYRVCSVLLVEPSTDELVIKATQSQSKEYTEKPRLRVGESVSGRAVQEKRVITVADVKDHPEYRFPDVARRAGLCSLAAVPLVSRGEAIGVLNCYTEKPHRFQKEEIAILQALGAQAAMAVEQAKLLVKSAVVQEMHHRVKNNLQQIASLVRLQMRFSEYTSVEQAMMDTLGRIQAIAAVHELLSRDDLDSVSITKVAEHILTATNQSVLPPGKTVHMSVVGPEIRLPLNQATSLALAINELVQNAVEHGFRDRDEGRVELRLAEDGREVRVTVYNDGVALPQGLDPSASPNLGLRIVNDLVRGGLGGSFTLCDVGGTMATVRFPRA
ncbi:MAG TPA: GAF domain-containing protein [Chthonomonadales bacterium]|nr:GAF domain-containing protein [Chthonomonadales bacterium]